MVAENSTIVLELLAHQCVSIESLFFEEVKHALTASLSVEKTVAVEFHSTVLFISSVCFIYYLKKKNSEKKYTIYNFFAMCFASVYLFKQNQLVIGKFIRKI